MIIRQVFKAHPIGQGFFYTGNLKSYRSEKKYNFVFDCGSLSNSVMNDTIDRYRGFNSNDSKDLDLLIISHFDADHVNGLKRLLNGRKIKCVIAPFINFRQRVTIALNYLDGFDTINETDPDIENTILTILDFTQALSGSITKDTEIIFVNSSKKNPPEEIDNENIEKLDNNINEFSFEFEGSEDLTQEEKIELGLSNITNAKKVDCDKIASITANQIKILDLIFYRKKVGDDDMKFFNKVFELFVSENKINFKDDKNPSMDEIIVILKSIKNARTIKPFFEEAAKNIKIDLTKKEIKNMNTTALCMMHWDKISSSLRRIQNPNRKFLIRGEIELSKIFGHKELLFPLTSSRYHPFHHYHRDFIYSSNTLLTSDSFLKDNIDVDSFINHYQNYLDNLLIFQVPHHGSKYSSSKYLFSRLPQNFSFINYGVNHCFIKRWSHPNDEVINNLIATGHASNLIPVHEYSGYQVDNKIHYFR